MGFGMMMANKMKSMARERKRNVTYRKEADKQIKAKSDAAYYRAKEAAAIKEAEARAREPSFKSKLKQGIKHAYKGHKKNRSGLGLQNTRNTMDDRFGLGGSKPIYDMGSSSGISSAFSLGGSKPQHGLTKKKAHKKRKGKTITIHL